CWSDDYLNLHSCPTRRSSDLDQASVRGSGRPAPDGARAGEALRLYVAARRGSRVAVSRVVAPGTVPLHRALGGPVPGATTRDTRSEEHTSELQSQSKLVCCLL